MLHVIILIPEWVHGHKGAPSGGLLSECLGATMESSKEFFGTLLSFVTLVGVVQCITLKAKS